MKQPSAKKTSAKPNEMPNEMHRFIVMGPETDVDDYSDCLADAKTAAKSLSKDGTDDDVYVIYKAVCIIKKKSVIEETAISQ